MSSADRCTGAFHLVRRIAVTVQQCRHPTNRRVSPSDTCVSCVSSSAGAFPTGRRIRQSLRRDREPQSGAPFLRMPTAACPAPAPSHLPPCAYVNSRKVLTGLAGYLASSLPQKCGSGAAASPVCRPNGQLPQGAFVRARVNSKERKAQVTAHAHGVKTRPTGGFSSIVPYRSRTHKYSIVASSGFVQQMWRSNAGSSF